MGYIYKNVDFSTRTSFRQCHHGFSIARHTSEKIYAWGQMLYLGFWLFLKLGTFRVTAARLWSGIKKSVLHCDCRLDWCLSPAEIYDDHLCSCVIMRQQPTEPSLETLTSKMAAISIMNGQQAAAAAAHDDDDDDAHSGVDDMMLSTCYA